MRIKTPSARVPLTSGQGTSRKAYQTARALGFKGTGSPGTGSAFKVKTAGPRSGVQQHPRDYGKVEPGFNVDYGETFNPPTDKDMWPGDDKK